MVHSRTSPAAPPVPLPQHCLHPAPSLPESVSWPSFQQRTLSSLQFRGQAVPAAQSSYLSSVSFGMALVGQAPAAACAIQGCPTARPLLRHSNQGHGCRAKSRKVSPSYCHPLRLGLHALAKGSFPPPQEGVRFQGGWLGNSSWFRNLARCQSYRPQSHGPPAEGGQCPLLGQKKGQKGQERGSRGSRLPPPE